MSKMYAILREDGWHIAEWDGECYNITSDFQSGDRLVPSQVKRAVCLPTEDAVDRILWNKRPTEEDVGGSIDEIVVHAPEMIHIEQMNHECWWMAIYKDGVDGYWMGNFIVEDGILNFYEQDYCDFKWDKDESHEER